MPTWFCNIPGYDLISPNRLLRMKWFMQSKCKEEAMQLIAVYGRPTPLFAEPVRMVIARQFGKRQRQLDTDNLYGGCKLLIDAMKAPKGRSRRGLSIISEDNPKALDLTVIQFRGHEDRCSISIWACPLTETLDIPEAIATMLSQSPK